jgi:acetyltransferase-like isoleucine patch superfamily enzyme
MDLADLIGRLTGRSACRKAHGARLTSRARILNARREPDRISIGRNTIVEAELFVFAHGGRIEIGEWCYIGPGTRVWSGARVAIGDRVLVAHNVNIIDNRTHPVAPAARHRHFQAIATRGHPRDIELGDEPIVVEDDAWIAAGASVLRGVRIGRGAIVGTGAVVTADVAEYTIVAGNPATVVRRLSAEEIEGP